MTFDLLRRNEFVNWEKIETFEPNLPTHQQRPSLSILLSLPSQHLDFEISEQTKVNDAAVNIQFI